MIINNNNNNHGLFKNVFFNLENTFYQIDDVFIPNERSSFWGTVKGLLKGIFETGKEKSLKLRRLKVFETLLKCCENGDLPIDSKHYSRNLFFKKCLLRNFFSAKMANVYNHVYSWKKLEFTCQHEVTS